MRNKGVITSENDRKYARKNFFKNCAKKLKNSLAK